MYRFVSTTSTQAKVALPVTAENQNVVKLAIPLEALSLVKTMTGVLYVSYGINMSDSLFCSMIIRFNNPQRPISLFLLLQHRR